MERTRILGNDYIGAWATATDKFFLIGGGAGAGEERAIRESMGVEGIRTGVGGSNLVGIYIAANSNGILVPYGMEEHDVAELRKMLPNVRVEVFNTDYNALKNNILANDRVAIINPHYAKEEEKLIGEVLHVETIRLAIAGFNTVGANNIITNKGLVLNNRASEAEKKRVEKLLGLRSEQSTANLGSVSIGLCAIANSNGIVAGQTTTGFELERIAEALDIS